MRLVRLSLQNFRQHAATEIHFRPGLTGIVGPNGAGKSTILEAIAWCIYGAPAARGTNDTIRFARAPARSRVQAELVFELGPHEFRVVRTLANAEVFLDGGAAPVATTIAGATDFLVARLGMNREEFFNTYFTGQKELQFLAQMGATQRARFFGQVLGYERLKVAQERARARRGELRHEIDGLRSGLPDPDELRAGLARAKGRATTAQRDLADVEAAAAAALRTLEIVAPEWAAAQAARERDRELAAAAAVAASEEEAARRDVARVEEELRTIATHEADLGGLRARLTVLPDVTRECERMSELARLAERRRALEENARAVAAELDASAARLERLRQAPELLTQVTSELEELAAALRVAEEQAAEEDREWQRHRQEAATKLETYRNRAQELKVQLQQLEDAGPDGTCPTCERPLGAEFDHVVAKLRDEWENVVQDGKWLKQRLDQLAARPVQLAEAEQRRAELNRQVTERTQRQAKCERALQELYELGEERSRKTAALEKLRAEIAELASDYDPDAHRRSEDRLRHLRELERKVTRLDEAVRGRPKRVRELDDALARATAAAQRIADTVREREALGYRDDAFAAASARFEAASRDARVAEVRLAESRGQFAAADEARIAAERAMAEYEKRRASLDSLESELRHHNELDSAFTQLRTELNARVRPELGELASVFITDITDGRYTQLEIDEAYNILVLDEGEEKPVISGGEEDVANLVLRLAISQMIAERAGHPLSLLVLDEVFGSLDVERRDRVVQLLHRLEDRFDQVILITHIETIREGLDQVIRVAYDERTGASVVTQESAFTLTHEEPTPAGAA